MTTIKLKLMILVCHLSLLIGRANEINGHFCDNIVVLASAVKI